MILEVQDMEQLNSYVKQRINDCLMHIIWFLWDSELHTLASKQRNQLMPTEARKSRETSEKTWSPLHEVNLNGIAKVR